MKLVDGLQIGDLQEQTLAVSENCRRLDGKNIVSPQTELSTRVLGRPVGAAVTVVPRLSEVRRRNLGDVRVERLREVDADSILVNMKTDWHLRRGRLPVVACVSDSLKASVVGRVGSPAHHARDIELAIDGIESAAMSARCEFTGQRHCGSLNPAVELVAEEQKRGAGTEREMHHLSFERTPAIAIDVNLATAGIVDPAGQIKHRQLGRLRAAGSGPAKEGQASRIG